MFLHLRPLECPVDFVLSNPDEFRQNRRGCGRKVAGQANRHLPVDIRAVAAVVAVSITITFQTTLVKIGIDADVVQVVDIDVPSLISYIGQLVIWRGHQFPGELSQALLGGCCRRHCCCCSCSGCCRWRGLRQRVVQIAVDVLVDTEQGGWFLPLLLRCCCQCLGRAGEMLHSGRGCRLPRHQELVLPLRGLHLILALILRALCCFSLTGCCCWCCGCTRCCC